jgi:hypothetical protein
MAALISIATGSVLFLGVVYACYKTGRGGVEHAKYSIVRSFKTLPLPFEVRKYEKSIAAKTFISTSSKDEMRAATSTGFRRVAGYIFGGNEKGEKIAMTAPVISIPMRQGTNTSGIELSFVLPSHIQNVNEISKPNSDHVSLEEIPVHFAAVYGFYGSYPTPEKIEEIGKILMQRMREEHIKAIPFPGGTIIDNESINLRVQAFDPPWTPSFLKLNEIVIIAGISEMSLN